MKALINTKLGECELMDIPEPSLSAGDDVKVRIDYCAMCATDVHIVTQGLYGRKTPWLMGHECCGTVAEAGPLAKPYGFAEGDKVAMYCASPCGNCESCKRGQDVFCTNKYPLELGFTEYCIAKPNMLFKIPPDSGVDHMYYCLVEPMAAALQGIGLAGVKPGMTVAVSGVGSIGSILLDMALLAGAARVTAIDPVPGKRALAKSLGAAHTIDPAGEDLYARCMEITGGRGFDVVFDAAGVPAAAPPLLKLIANRGTVVYFAVFPMGYELPVNLYELYLKEGRLQTVYTSIYNVPRVMEMMPRMHLDKIVTRVLPLPRAKEAFDLFLQSKDNKIVVKCSDWDNM